ncbi:D-alanyl-D-alanine carboxypeptidase (penicillin-binding protein 5/6) [Streptomyces sp. Termitarium-T10T-6]|nr:D-alanyl-D-alanine carboxypeptidase (penicillin-binding protein 5/6) [Streptomyces sp. Termitarium-T10T-6]
MPVLKKIALTVTSAALLSGFTLTPAVAADKDKSDDKQPKPPGVMSSLGGERLGMSGSQVNLGPGCRCCPRG